MKKMRSFLLLLLLVAVSPISSQQTSCTDLESIYNTRSCCTDTPVTFNLCALPSTWNGTHCEVPSCLTEPVENQEWDGTQCVCVTGYSGTACESRVLFDSVDNCVLTVNSGDSPDEWYADDMLIIGSQADLNALSTAVSGCGEWSIVGGGLYIFHADDVVSLEALSNLKSINGHSESGYSLLIRGNDVLTSLAGLRGLTGTLSGAVAVRDNPSLESLSGLERVTNIATNTKSTSGLSFEIYDNTALCLTTSDRARVTSCSTIPIPGCSFASCASGGCDGTMFAIGPNDGGYVMVQGENDPPSSNCNSCANAFSVGGANTCLPP